MNRSVVSISFIATSLAGGCMAAEPQTQVLDRPNVILILADDLGYGDSSVYGETRFRTPNIDALASEGIRFLNAYAGAPVCAPSRCTLLTGKDTAHAQIRGNLPLGNFTDEGEKGDLPLSPGTVTLGSIFKSAGYKTAAVGKWDSGGPGSSGVPWQHGFDSFYGYLSDYQAHNYFPTHLWANETRVPLDNKFFIPHWFIGHESPKAENFRDYLGRDYSPYKLISEAEKIIASNQDTPFFLYFAPTLPHSPLQVPEAALKPFLGRWPETPVNGGLYTPQPTPRAARAAMITELDNEVGRIVAEVRRLKMEQRTLIIFTSDNGPDKDGGQDLAFFNAAGGLRGGKHDVYDGGIREPFIASWPGHIPAGRTDATPIAFWDVMPTLAQLVDSPTDLHTNGLSLLPLLLARGTLPERSLYWESHEASGRGQGVRIGRWKGVRHQPHGFNPNAYVELYDLANDPIESVDVAAQHPEIVAQMVEVMAGRVASSFRAFNF